jgi:hypothetical protein
VFAGCRRPWLCWEILERTIAPLNMVLQRFSRPKGPDPTISRFEQPRGYQAAKNEITHNVQSIVFSDRFRNIKLSSHEIHWLFLSAGQQPIGSNLPYEDKAQRRQSNILLAKSILFPGNPNYARKMPFTTQDLGLSTR